MERARWPNWFVGDEHGTWLRFPPNEAAHQIVGLLKHGSSGDSTTRSSSESGWMLATMLATQSCSGRTSMSVMATHSPEACSTAHWRPADRPRGAGGGRSRENLVPLPGRGRGKNRFCTVVRTIVDDQNFDVGVRLVEKGLQTPSIQ